jgi:hypothetical protein
MLPVAQDTMQQQGSHGTCSPGGAMGPAAAAEARTQAMACLSWLLQMQALGDWSPVATLFHANEAFLQ